MPKKFTYKFVKKIFEDNEYKLLSDKYINTHSKLNYICPNNHNGSISFNNFSRGQRCAKCSKYKNRYTISYIKKLVPELEKGYRCISDNYYRRSKKLKFICNKNHIYKTDWANFLQGNRCPICFRKNNKRGNHPRWKGGKKVSWYDTYAPQIDWCEEVRRDPDNEDYLQVKCTNFECREWFSPTREEAAKRTDAINGKYNRREDRFYCSDKCKQECSLYRQHKYPKGYVPDHFKRPDQKDWADLVKERDNYECVKCGRKDLPLVAHHIEGLNVNPIESADIDLGITFCSECDKLIHSEVGCRPIDLRRDSLCPQ